MNDRDLALSQIAELARRHRLTADEIAAALGARPPQEGRSQRVLVRVLGILGGTFVFAGVAVFIALQWDDLNSAARVIVTLGSGLAAFVLAELAGRDERVVAAATPLLLAAAALEPTGMLVAFNEYGSGGDWRLASLITCGTMALQFAGSFSARKRATPLFLVVLFGTLFFWTALDLLDADETLIAVVLGAALLLTSFALDRRGFNLITPFWYFCGAAAFLAGLFDAVEGSVLEILFLAAAAGLVYASVVAHSRTLLSVATLAILAYTGYFTGQHFVDSIGWPLALVGFGLFMIGLSAVAFRIDRNYVRPMAVRP